MGGVDGVDGQTKASVLLSFRAENVRSFKDELELSLLATGLAEKQVVRELTWRQGGKPLAVLPGAGLFGANASGKSNVLRAMDDMRSLVLYSFRAGTPNGGIPRRPFVLDAASRGKPSRFEVDIVLSGVRHEYGLVVDDKRVIKEWAYRYPHGRAALLFERDEGEVVLGPSHRAVGQAVKRLLRSNALFLSTAAVADHPDLTGLYNWFETNLWLAETNSRPFRQAMTARLLDDEGCREQVRALLKAADLGVVAAKRQDIDPEMRERLQKAMQIILGREADTDHEPPPFEEMGIRLTHRGAAGEVELSAEDESLGTLVWFGLVGPVVEALAHGSVLLADELDASLHPGLVAEIIRLFQSPVSNPRHAQLIFNSHDVTMLGESTGERLLGRDQIWFTEKYSDGRSHLFPLSDLDPRKEEAIARRYLAGRYGAVPIISSQDFAAAAEAVTSGGGR